jgi:DNA-binding CsgD family transcriptional regulator
MFQLDLEDVERIVRLVAEAGDPTVEMTLPHRKRFLLEGVARLIDAEVWLWSTAVPNPNVDGDIMTTCMIEGGWRDEQERVLVYEALTDPEIRDGFGAAVLKIIRKNDFVTLRRDEIVAPEQQDRIASVWGRTGLSHSLFALFPLGPDQFSGVGFHRRQGRPNFTERDRSIVYVLFRQVEWLHRHGTNEEAKSRVVQLAPRERQVLLFLLGGDSRKDIARKMGISEHTVGDYMKKLHKHFAVNSRAELQAYFMLGGQDPS